MNNNDVYRIQQVRILDPESGRDETGELVLADGRVAPPGIVPAGRRIVDIDARGWVAVPAFLDLHVHLREPGGEAAETVESGTRAAAAGGFGLVVSMPNTRPPTDTPARVRQILDLARAAGCCEVGPSACLTRERSGGQVASLAGLAAAGAVAFTDDGGTVMDDAVMQAAMAEAARLGRPVMDHAQDHEAEKRGVMHEGAASRRAGLPGIPSAAEVRIVERDIRLARETGAALHIQHLSAADSVDLIRRARADGLRVSAEATPHHLALCDEDIDPADANFKMNPPLRGAADREALRRAVAEGVITCFATDHAPHPADSKARGFAGAPFGIIGLETAVGVTYTELVVPGRMALREWVRRWTSGPAAVLGRPAPRLAPGAPAHVALLDLTTSWTVDPTRFQSRSRNTPFGGRELKGRAMMTFHAGRRVWCAPEAEAR